MWDNIWGNAVGGILVIVVWGVITILKDKVSEFVFNKRTKCNYKKLEGEWNGVHFTRRDNKTVISRHHYELKIKGNKIIGHYDELLADPPYPFQVTGEISPPNIVLTGKAELTSETALTLRYNNVNLNKLVGFYVGHDFDKKPFSSPIILSRDEVSDEECIKLMQSIGENYLYKM